MEPVRAAGGVVTRHGPGGELEVVVILRARYGDWTFPKGKREPGETDEHCALREVDEETTLRCALGRELGTTRYEVRGRAKSVRYFAMEPMRGELSAGDGVDEARWLTPAAAGELLSYERDRDLLERLQPEAAARASRSK